MFLFFDIDALLAADVVLDASTVRAADYPLYHLLLLANEFAGNIADIVERLECDGWSPVEIASGVADPKTYAGQFGEDAA